MFSKAIRCFLPQHVLLLLFSLLTLALALQPSNSSLASPEPSMWGEQSVERNTLPKVSDVAASRNISAPFEWYRYQGEASSSNYYCGQACAAMAIQFAHNNERVAISDIVNYIPGQSGWTSTSDLLNALAHWNVDRTTIASGNMNGVRDAINNRGHIVLVPIIRGEIPLGSDWNVKRSDPASHWNLYHNPNNPWTGGHWVVVKGISDDQNWVIVYDPLAFNGNDYYWYSDSTAKGRERYYSYSDFARAFANNGAQAIEILEVPTPPSCPQSGGVILYWNANYDCAGRSDGYVQRTSTGWQNVPGSFNDQASSVRVPSGWSVMLYENSDKGAGGKKCFSADDSDFANDTFDNGVGLNDKVSSFEVFDSPNCPSPTHLECQSNQCVRVSGSGTDQCSPEGSYCPPPSGNWHAKYFDNQQCQDPNCTTTPRCEEDFAGPFIDKFWGASAPCGMNGDYWGALFTGRFNFSGGNYVFHIDHDDGARLFLDGQCIQEVWNDTGLHHACPPRYLSGEHDVAVAYRENTGDAKLHLWWDTDPSQCIRDDAEFVSQSQYPTVETGQQFSIYFEVRNTGNTTWRDSDGYGLENINGVTLGAWFRQEIGADVPPGATKRWDIDMTAPSEPGVYPTQWMLKHWDQRFGPNMFIIVTVVPPQDTTPPTGRITSHSDGDYLNSNSVLVTADASDTGSGVRNVSFLYLYGDWHQFAEDWDGSDGWQAVWDTTSIPDGTGLALDIMVFDWAGNWSGDVVWNLTLDRQPPSSWVDPLPEFQETTSFEVSWSHDPDLSGIREYWVQYRYGQSGMWQAWYAGSDTSAVFQYADDGVTYYFRVRAIDNAGNEEEYPGGDGDTHTTIDLAPACGDSHEPNDGPGTATPISSGQTYSDPDICPAGDWDYYSIPANTGDTIHAYVDAETLDSLLDSYLFLYRPDGTTEVCHNDDWGGSLDSELSCVVPSTGTYYVAVTDYSTVWGSPEGGPDYYYHIFTEVIPGGGPNAPSNLSASAVSQSQINLSWNDNSDNESGFKIYRNGSYIGVAGANITSFYDYDLACGTTYSYYVKAYNSGGESGPSNTASATTYPCPTPTPTPTRFDIFLPIVFRNY